MNKNLFEKILQESVADYRKCSDFDDCLEQFYDANVEEYVEALVTQKIEPEDFFKILAQDVYTDLDCGPERDKDIGTMAVAILLGANNSIGSWFENDPLAQRFAEVAQTIQTAD